MRHPVLGNRVWLIVWWLAWLFLALCQSLLIYIAYGSFNILNLADSLISSSIYSGLGITLWYPFRFFNSGEAKKIALLSNLVLTGAITISLWIFITKFILTLFIEDYDIFHPYWETTFPLRIGTGIFIYGLVILAYYLFVSLSNLSEKNAKEARLESIVKETELRLLRSQINPHFLFNSLNSISSLTVTNPEKARIMIVKLSEFMRYALSRKDDHTVPLRNELENIRLYLDIEQVRFGEKLTTNESVDKDCNDLKIPVMLLQPLYENAIKHGVYESTGNVRIYTQATLINGYMEVIISNNFDPGSSSSKGTGTGLLNVARRLELSYGKNSSLQTTMENGVYTVRLIIPADNI